MRLWDLPSARRFVESTCMVLEDGNSVVVAFVGSTVPDGFVAAVRDTERSGLRPSQNSAAGVQLDPVQQLLRWQYCERPETVLNEVDLCQSVEFRGRLIRVTDVDERTWPAWGAFLRRYAQASRSMPMRGRTRFFLPFAGVPPPSGLDADVGLAVLRWAGLERLDLLNLADHRLRERRIHEPMRSLLAETVARVAAWDFDTAESLLAEDERGIISPRVLLASIGSRRGWTAETAGLWHFGTASESGVRHAALVALEARSAELEHRLWSAQVAVLLPWIEARSRDVVQKNRDMVARRMTVAGLENGDPLSLEVGELQRIFKDDGRSRRRDHGQVRATQAGGSKGFGGRQLRDVQRLFKLLHAARNKLAHRECLSFDEIDQLTRSRQSG